MARLRDLARLVRSKNAGPFQLTFDVLFDDEAKYLRVKNSNVLSRRLFAEMWRLPEEKVSLYHYDAAWAIKVTVPRPFVSGSVVLPSSRQDVMFVPQMPYMPLGDLRAAASYPLEEGAVTDREIQQALVKVALSHLVIRLNDVRDWAKVLSVGEQQRVAFARILLSKPRAVFLDESTSAMDEGLELMLYELLRAEFPDTILVSVSHRSTVEQFHDRHLELVGGGEWRLDPLPTMR